MNDLTWAELLASLLPDSIYVDATRGVCINISKVSQETTNITSLTSPGVIEFCYKLLDAAAKAQKAKNSSLPTGSKLNAFSDPTWSTPNASGMATARHTVAAQFPLNMTTATAPLI